MGKTPDVKELEYIVQAAETQIDSARVIILQIQDSDLRRRVKAKLAVLYGLIKRIQTAYPQRYYSLVRWSAPGPHDRRGLTYGQWVKQRARERNEKLDSW